MEESIFAGKSNNDNEDFNDKGGFIPYELKVVSCDLGVPILRK